MFQIGESFTAHNMRYLLYYLIVFFLQAGISLGIIRCCLTVVDHDTFNPLDVFKQFDFLFSYVSSIVLLVFLGIIIFLPSMFILYGKYNVLELFAAGSIDLVNIMENFFSTLNYKEELIVFLSTLCFLYVSLRLFFAPYFILDHSSGPSGLQALFMSYSFTKGKTLQLIPMFFVMLIIGYFPNILTFFLMPITIVLPTLYFKYLNDF